MKKIALAYRARVHVAFGAMVVRSQRCCVGLFAVLSVLLIQPAAVSAAYTVDTSTAPLTGLWWNENESGWGMSLTQQGPIVFVAWYTYDETGKPTWLVMSSCPLIGSACTGDIYKVSGGTSLGVPWNGASKVVTKVGTGTLSFSDNDTGTFSYSVNGGSGMRTITRQFFANGTTLPTINYSALWWNANEPGWGVAVTQQYGTIFATLYTYDTSGTPVWYVASNCPIIGKGCAGDLYQVTGGSTPTSAWNAPNKFVAKVGTISFMFTDGSNGVMSYSIDGANGLRSISTQQFYTPPFTGKSFDIQGISMSTFGLTNYEGPILPGLFKGAVNDGANFVVLSNQAVIDTSTGTISDWIVTSGSNTWNQTAKFSDMGPAIAAAQAQGLNVMLKPQIAAYDPAIARWTGSDYGNLTDTNLAISNPTTFFAGYKAYILKWAALAQQYNVPILCIGNEMLAATKPMYTSYWLDIISSIRSVYSGKLTYAALGGEEQQIEFWNKLDYIGFDVYPSLTTQLDPNISTLNAAWQQLGWYRNVGQQLANQYGKQILFTETGVASFPGANDRNDFHDPVIGLSTTKSDYSEQSNWLESFFETWALNKPSWLAGIFLWNNDPGATTDPWYSNGYNFNGKPAELIVSSWYGGRDYLNSKDSSFTGSVANDRICLYGDQFATSIQAANGTKVTQQQTFNTTISASIAGTIINGQTPTVHFYVNGIDEGAYTLQNSPGGYIDPQGITWTIPQTITVTLPGLSNISQLKVAFDSAVNLGSAENSMASVYSASINGVALTQATYYPPQGGAPQQVTATKSYFFGWWDGGYSLIDASPWNNQLASRNIGTAANPFQVNGGGGVDTVFVLGNQTQYTVSGIGTGTVYLFENSGLNQNAILVNIARVMFQDGSILMLQ